jgi:ribonuclease HII
MLKSRFLDVELEAGCDEAGAGCGFGPVVAACVILPKDFNHINIKDSKKLSAKKREEMFDLIVNNAVFYSIKEVSSETIDQINILQARMLAFDLSIKDLGIIPEHILIDGNRFIKDYPIKYTCIVKGDSTYTSIAAASILAKVFRDRLMQSLQSEYKNWDIYKNKGYLTKEHINYIKQFGISDLHRKTFCKKFTI